MGFKEAVRTCLTRKYARFSGRASRSEYWYFVLFCWLVTLVLAFLISLVGGASFNLSIGDNVLFFSEEDNSSGLILLLVWLYFFFPWIAVSTRRFHDVGFSGFWYLGSWVMWFIPFIGLISAIAVIVVVVMRGTNGANKYGPDPLDQEATADVFA